MSKFVEMIELDSSFFQLYFAQEQEFMDIKHECKKSPLNVDHLQKFIVVFSPTACYLESWLFVPAFNLFITVSVERRRRLGI